MRRTLVKASINPTQWMLVASLVLVSFSYAQTNTAPIAGTSTMPRSAAFDKFDTGAVLAMEEVPSAQPGRFHRVKLVKASFKYPLIRMEESVEDLPSGREINRDKMMVADHVVVRLQKGTNAAQFARRNGFSVRRKTLLPDVYLLAVPATLTGVPVAIKKLEKQPEVIFVQADYILQGTKVPDNSPSFGEQWALDNIGQNNGVTDADIDAPEAWNSSTGSSSVKVAILDSGVWYNHPDLAGNMGFNAGEISNNGIDDDGNGLIDDKLGWDFVNNDADPVDDEGHGTSVAGIIGAIGNNNIGGSGVCWSVKMIPVKVLDESNFTVGSSLSDGIWYAASLGVDVINISVGGYDYDAAKALALEETSKKNIVIVCSVGNEGNDNDASSFYPAGYDVPNIISVAATDRKDHLVNIPNWWASNYGINSVDLAAPGQDCYTTAMPSTYRLFNGTSAAAPYVTGVCALVKAVNPAFNAFQIKTAVLQSVDKIPALSGKVATGGRLNAFGAVQVALGNTPLVLKPMPDSYIVPFNKSLFVKDGASTSDATSVTTSPTVLGNDIVPNNTSLVVSLHTQPNKGGFVWFGPKAGEFHYKSHSNFFGVETFKYDVVAGPYTSVDEGTVTVTTLAPTAEDDFYKNSGNQIVVNDGYGVFENDGFGIDEDADNVPEITKQPLYGNLVPEMKNNLWTGRFTYVRTSNATINATDSFQYRVSMPNCGKKTNIATVMLTTMFTPIYNLVWEEWMLPGPIKEEISSYVAISADAVAPIKINVQFPEGSQGKVTIKRKPSHGMVTLSRNNQLEYIPKRGATGADKFQIVLANAFKGRAIEVTIQPESASSL